MLAARPWMCAGLTSRAMLYIYIYIYTHTHSYVYIYIYITTTIVIHVLLCCLFAWPRAPSFKEAQHFTRIVVCFLSACLYVHVIVLKCCLTFDLYVCICPFWCIYLFSTPPKSTAAAASACQQRERHHLFNKRTIKKTKTLKKDTTIKQKKTEIQHMLKTKQNTKHVCLFVV